jgi:hypothetical protein
MNYYKFTRTSGTYQIAVRNDLGGDISSYFNGDIIFSEYDEIIDNGHRYVLNKDDGLFYDAYNEIRNTANFTKTVSSDSVVVDLTRSGLTIYDSKRNPKVIGHADVDDHLMLNLSFYTDDSSNVWASVSYQDEDGTWKDGYIIYKNYRNNFANVRISDFHYGTVLTDGSVDNAKVVELKEKAVGGSATSKRRAARSTSGTSSTTKSTTTTKVTLPTTSRSSSKTGDKTTGSSTVSTYAGRVDAYGDNLTQFAKDVANHSPNVVQNQKNYPKATKYTDTKGRTQYKYDYSTIVDTDSIKAIYPLHDLDVRTFKSNFSYNAKYYNRFKKAMPDDVLSKGFMHIFFTRPDLNLYDESSNLVSKVKKDAFFNYKHKQKPNLLHQLCHIDGDDFMYFLSNKAGSFSLTDESIKYAEYGKNFQNYSIQLGKGIFDSQVASTFDISYVDDRDYDVMAIHKMWIQYISNVYHGNWDPKTQYIYKKILDYAVSVHVIVTAEDFETILYWSKYYGVFPINVPYSALSWETGNFVSKNSMNITYGYSWKEDWNPAALTDLNVNCFGYNAVSSAKYIQTYNSNLGRTGTTWVGEPFVETIKDLSTEGKQYGSGVILKLRFKPGPITT